MKLSFTLSMPSNNSWNGKWSGSEKKYVRVIDFGKTQKAAVKASAILAKGYYSYNFGDGWRAGVTVAEVDNATAKRLTKETDGFCGYEWMIQSIRDHGNIYSDPPTAAVGLPAEVTP